MATSSLLQTGEQPPSVDKGHGTGALGPSDSSDTGSDIQGNSGLADDPGMGLSTGTNEDSYGGVHHGNAGADVGDADLDSDSDRYGTGERGAAGRDSMQPVDQTFAEQDADDVESDDLPEQELETLEGLEADDDAADVDMNSPDR